ncbi:MAG: sortase [bacterium]|nr:sortase [bacterium]
MFTPYRYEKAPLRPLRKRQVVATESAPATVTLHLPRPAFFSSRLLQAIPISLIMVGSGLISSQIVIPFLEIRLETKSLVEPITAGGLNLQQPGEVLGGNVSTGMGEFAELSEIKLETPPPTPEEPQAPPPPFFYLSIPKLGIEKAKVETNSTSMKPDTALGHYLGTGLPGGTGLNRNNVFIYGHSALPRYFDPINYKTIFATLEDKLEIGDDFLLYYNDKIFKYTIKARQVLKPKDVNPLNPVPWLSPGVSYATLMTCVPSGGVSERLLIVGELTKD